MGTHGLMVYIYFKCPSPLLYFAQKSGCFQLPCHCNIPNIQKILSMYTVYINIQYVYYQTVLYSVKLIKDNGQTLN